MHIHLNGWVHQLLRLLAEKQHNTQRELELYKIALENAYEGIVIADANGKILTINQTYASLIGKKLVDLAGKHVTEVIQNTRLHIVAKTGRAEIADLQQMQGHWMIASRIPIFNEGEVVAVVGKIMFQDIDTLFEINAKFREIKNHLHYNEGKARELSGAQYSFQQLIGVSKGLQRVKIMGEKVAKSNSTVLLSGETGTGKELFAHAIHQESGRRFGPFVTVNCAAVPEALFESELFGYKEGSFTGAKRAGKKGKFSLANKGTIFLDEISEMPITQQVKLLRVLQEKQIEPVGGEKPELIDVRVIAATNRDLAKLVKENKFRQDLYYRLNVVQLEIPPLRERREDIPPLIHHMLQQLQQETGITTDGIEPEAIRSLAAYDWPGNVRELRNVLERSLFWKEGAQIKRADLPTEVTGASDLSWSGEADAVVADVTKMPVVPVGAESRVKPDSVELESTMHSLHEELERVEARWINEVLQQEKGDKLAAAKRLGISKSSFYKKVDKYGIQY